MSAVIKVYKPVVRVITLITVLLVDLMSFIFPLDYKASFYW